MPVTIIEPLGELEEAFEGHIGGDQLQRYGNALAAYRSGDFETAYEEFVALDGDPAADKAATRALIDDPPTEP